jgi:hypothetical protein
MTTDPWTTIATAKWDPATAQLHDIDAHRRWTAGAWPHCPRCSALAIEFHDRHSLGHLVPTEARNRQEHDQS